MPRDVARILFDRAFDQYGFVTADDARSLGINHQRLVDMERRGTLERVARGLYRFRVIPYTGREHLMEAVLWPRRTRGVVSHDTALHLHDLCDIDPSKVHITVPRAYRINRTIPSGYAIHHRDLSPVDRAVVEGIPTVTPLRAIKDGIDTHVDPKLVDQAIDTARRRGLIRGRDLADLDRRARDA
ncbi:MAG: type IV toxin-antitoxin system AbiEi family antitoxin domain-containing protein [Thermoleophilaceae bacterium]